MLCCVLRDETEAHTGAPTFCRCRKAACARRLTSARGVGGSRPPLPPLVDSRRGPVLPLATDDSRSVIAGW